jgi:hypothetical protein
MSWIVHTVLFAETTASVAHCPVQCQVLKSGVFDAWQLLLRCTSLTWPAVNTHGVPTQPSDTGGVDDVWHLRHPESGAKVQVRPPMHSATHTPSTQLQIVAPQNKPTPAGGVPQSAGAVHRGG